MECEMENGEEKETEDDARCGVWSVSKGICSDVYDVYRKINNKLKFNLLIYPIFCTLIQTKFEYRHQSITHIQNATLQMR